MLVRPLFEVQQTARQARIRRSPLARLASYSWSMRSAPSFLAPVTTVFPASMHMSNEGARSRHVPVRIAPNFYAVPAAPRGNQEGVAILDTRVRTLQLFGPGRVYARRERVFANVSQTFLICGSA